MAATQNSAFIALLTTAAALSDDEVAAELRAEILREKQAVDRAMQVVIAEGRRRTFYLSLAIYKPLEEIEEWLSISQAALARDGNPETRPYIEGAIQQQTVELDVARRLRALRAPISHMDPPDYWERLRKQAGQKFIMCNPNWKDAA